MTDLDLTKVVEMRPPALCLLWEHPERATGKFADLFEEIETYEDASLLTRVRACTGAADAASCHEWVDWDEGDIPRSFPLRRGRKLRRPRDRHLQPDALLSALTMGRRDADLEWQRLTAVTAVKQMVLIETKTRPDDWGVSESQ